MWAVVGRFAGFGEALWLAAVKRDTDIAATASNITRNLILLG
jgi:hypothetical protein